MRFRGASVIAAAALAATLAADAEQDRQSSPPQLAPPYVPEGTAQELGLVDYAKILCSAVFVQGRDPVEGATNSAYWIAQNNQVPLDQITYRVDRETKTVTATFGTIARWANYYGDQGCVLPAHGRNDIAFTPVPVKTTLPDAMTQAWPMGDKVDTTPLPAEVDKARLDAAVDAAFADPAALTAGFIVVYKGHIIAERYGAGADRDTQLESWSMGKSIASTLFALLVKDGTYTLDQPAPVALWQVPGDPRAKIRNRDLLQMSGGLLFQGPDHYYIYTGGVDSFDYSINRPPEFPPGTEGRYLNGDPLTIGYLIKQAVSKRGEAYLTWPQKALFDKIGIRRQVIEPDPYGNFIMTGYDFGTARNWARLGLLYLQDGIWQAREFCQRAGRSS